MWRPVRDGMLIVQFVNVVGFWLLKVLMCTRSDHRPRLGGAPARPGDEFALESGAKGFLVKDDPVEQLAASIRRVLAGEIVVNPHLAAQALTASPNPLSDRERQVLSAASGGATIADIAGQLHLSPSTVRNYLSSAIGKTGTRNRSEALSLARDRGWL